MSYIKSIVRNMVCLLLFSSGLSAQTGTFADSLFRIFKNAKDDSTKAAAAVQLAAVYQTSHPDTSIYYASQGERLFQALHNAEGIFDAVAEKCYAYAYARNDIEALRQLARLEKISKQIKNKITENWFIYISGDIYQDIEEYGKALGYYRRILNNYIQLAQHDKEYVGRVGNVNIMIGEVYNKMDNPDSSLYYLYRGKSVYDSMKWEWALIPILIGDDHRKKGNMDSAFHYFRWGLSLALKYEAGPLNLQKAYLGLAHCFYSINNHDSCKTYASLALSENAKGSYPDWTLVIHQLLGKVYQSKNQPESALYHVNKAITIRDSLYNAGKIRLIQRLDFEKQIQQQQQEQKAKTYQTYLWISILAGSLFTVLVVVFIQFKNQKEKQKAYEVLQKQKEETDIQTSKAEKSLNELKSTQAQLIHREKMASLGELTAGIAHEIQNPLNFVNNFSEVNTELIEELKSEKSKVKSQRDELLEDELLNEIAENEQKIVQHGKRADAIVKGMLQHSQRSTGQKEPTDINALADEYLRLSYHGLRAKDKSFNAIIQTHFDESIGKIEVIPQDIGRVLLNLFNNAFYAVKSPNVVKGEDYVPTVTVTTKRISSPSGEGGLEIRVKDNGMGIPQKVVDKIFQPFFTTKPTGQGTGLGLSLSYDIIKAHGGEFKVETKEGEYAEFKIALPGAT